MNVRICADAPLRRVDCAELRAAEAEPSRPAEPGSAAGTPPCDAAAAEARDAATGCGRDDLLAAAVAQRARARVCFGALPPQRLLQPSPERGVSLASFMS
jgi:hypothetical protein